MIHFDVSRACYYWIPIWGIVLSLLYLSRAHSPRKTFKSERPPTSIPSYSNNAMIGEDEEGDLDSHYTHSGDGAGLTQALLSHSEADESSESGSSQHYLRGGFANNSYPPERTGSRDDDSVSSGITGDTSNGDGHLSLLQMRSQQQQQQNYNVYSPDDSGNSHRESNATLTPMADLYHKGGLLMMSDYDEEHQGPQGQGFRTYSEDT